MDDAEFRRVRDLLITGKGSQGREHRDVRAELRPEERPPTFPPAEPPTPTDPE
jgi:hypothetical protein